jgi:hypothetical protein
MATRVDWDLDAGLRIYVGKNYEARYLKSILVDQKAR